MIYKEFNPEDMAWQLIYDRDETTLTELLKELKIYRSMRCEYCGGTLEMQDGHPVMHTECPEGPWCECGRSELKGDCSVCDYED